MASEIQTIVSEYKQGKVSDTIAEYLLLKLDKRELAEFILDAIDRGWISNFNLGLDEDGKII